MATTPVFMPGKSHGHKSLVGYSPWAHRESDTATFAHNTSWCSFLYPFTCNILKSLYLKLVSYRQHISGSSFSFFNLLWQPQSFS